MKKLLAIMLALLLVTGLAACGTDNSGENTGGGQDIKAEEPEQKTAAHKIAVLVYDYSDDEVSAFRKYFIDYLGKEFDTEFIYSESISSPEAALDFIEQASEYGAEGVISFNSYDLEKEVGLAAEKGMYFMMGSGTVPDDQFEAVADNEYFIGVIGPGDEFEYMAGQNLVESALKEENRGTSYLILSGGGCVGNEMHRLRTLGMLDKLENAYGVKFEEDKEKAAVSSEIMHIKAGDLSVCIAPGYLSNEENLKKLKAELEDPEIPYDHVLATLPATRVMNEIGDATLAVVDCYSENNLRYFISGDLNYVTGKYGSLVGPSFAAMYNAVSGHPEVFRDNGKAFRLKQGFWSSDSREDYEEKYGMASSIEKCAYNYEDIQSVLTDYNKDATLEDLKALTEAYKFEDALARRAA